MAIYAQDASKKKIKRLFERYTKSYVESKVSAREFSEQDTATKFIKPLMEALGWNVLSMQEVREEVYFNEKFIDCVLYSEGISHVVFEFKSLGFGVLRNKVDVSELIKNAKALGAKYAVITRFRETIIYNPETGEEIEYFVPTDYIDKFDILWKYLSKPLST